MFLAKKNPFWEYSPEMFKKLYSDKMAQNDFAVLKVVCERPGLTSFDFADRKKKDSNHENRREARSEQRIPYTTAAMALKKLEGLGLLTSHEEKTGKRVKTKYEPTIKGLLEYVQGYFDGDPVGVWSTLKKYEEFSNPLLQELMGSAFDDYNYLICHSIFFFGRHMHRNELMAISTEDVVEYLTTTPFLAQYSQFDSYWTSFATLLSTENPAMLKILMAHKKEVVPILEKRIQEEKARFEAYIEAVKKIKASLSS